MTTRDTAMGGGTRPFPPTSWTLIRSVQSDASRESLERLIRLYWKPAYFYLRAAGRKDVEEAKDLTQDFFSRMLERRDWERLDPALGSFRGFLKRALRNFMVDAARRDKVRRPESGVFVFAFDECRDAAPEGPDLETAFDRQWSQTVLRASIDELERRLPNPFQVFRLYCLEGGGRTYGEVALETGLNENEVGKRLVLCRAELREIVLERIREYIGDDADVESEFLQILKE